MDVARAGSTSTSLLSLDGLDQLQAMVDGTAPRPPIMDTLDICGFEPERGRVVVELRAQEFHYNPLGRVHGGVISTLLDTAAGVRGALDAGGRASSTPRST